MFSLFKKKEAAAPPQQRLADCLQKKDYAGLAKAYYDMGRAAMDSGDPGRAMLWLSRADTIYSARDDVYEAVGDKLADDCSDRIGALEDAPLLSNQIVEEIDDKRDGLGDAQARVWSLLTLSRLAPMGDKLAQLPGCGVLGQLGKCVDLAVQSFQTPISQEEFDFLKTVCGELYALSDSQDFFAGGEVPCAAGAPLQVFDLNGLTTLLGIEGLLDGQLRCLAGEPAADDGGLIPCALVPDYWTRTVGGDLRAIPQVKAELERIWADYDFIRSGPTWAAVAQRIQAYRSLDLFAV
ncbi:MAG: hypothetical protein HFF29_07860 [Oscillospiraceae bacterium]|nr:hypothetical protein [Oscillospiraceae bacterium]